MFDKEIMHQQKCSRVSENLKILSVIRTDDLACSASPKQILSVRIKQILVLQ